MARPVLVASLVALAGCISGTVDHPMQDVLQGTWSGCTSDGGADVAERLAFDDDRLGWTTNTFATADGTCGGSPIASTVFSASYVIGEPMKVTLDGAEVDAYGLDVTADGRTFYTTIHVDAQRSPRALYVGEPDLSTGRDMTSGAKRPIVLTRPLVEE